MVPRRPLTHATRKRGSTIGPAAIGLAAAAPAGIFISSAGNAAGMVAHGTSLARKHGHISPMALDRKLGPQRKAYRKQATYRTKDGRAFMRKHPSYQRHSAFLLGARSEFAVSTATTLPLMIGGGLLAGPAGLIGGGIASNVLGVAAGNYSYGRAIRRQYKLVKR